MKNKARNWLASVIVLTAGLGLAAPASAAVILSPVSATVETGTGFGNINDIINQSGLDQTFTSGVTDFDTYLSGNPLHSFIFTDQEAAVQANTNGDARVFFDLGASYTLSAFALWNEEVSGIPAFNLSVSLDNNSFTQVVTNGLPTNNPEDQDYPADRFDFGNVTARYIQFDLLGCTTDTPFGFCAIGEVAFRGTPTSNDIPEPGVLGLAGIGLFALGLILRRKGRRATPPAPQP